MQTIHCTQKLLKELGKQGATIPQSATQHSLLGPWHANLIRIERRKCSLFTNGCTLYSFLVPGVKKADLNNFRELFLLHLKMNLMKEGFRTEDINKALGAYEEISVAPTTNRSVLGSMNDLVNQSDFLVYRAGGLDKADMLLVNMLLNRIPMGALKYQYPIEKLYERFGRQDKVSLPVNSIFRTDSDVDGPA
jgi:hypothetical protein